MIKFEYVGMSNNHSRKPSRSTKASAGYDFYAPHDIVIPAWGKSELIWSGWAVQLPSRLFLKIENRSSLMKKNIEVKCSGIIDADYYGNPSNKGNIGVQFYNFGEEDVVIFKGEKMCQGIIQAYYVTDDDEAEGERVGGFGSTGK